MSITNISKQHRSGRNKFLVSIIGNNLSNRNNPVKREICVMDNRIFRFNSFELAIYPVAVW